MKYTGKKTSLILCAAGISLLISGCGAGSAVTSFEKENYNKSIYEAELFAEDLCVTDSDVSISGFEGDSSLHAEGLFDLTDHTVEYGYNLFERLYPASTTKILTALVAIKNSDMDDVVTVSRNAAASSFGWEDQVCGLQEGDQLTMRDLLYGLLLWSGNDNAVAIAEHVGGDVDTFMEMVNDQAAELMATGTHFVTPNGLHDPDHYTTAYDLYLIFNECIKHEEFMDIISASSYTANVTGADGTARQLTWEPTNYYARGTAALPEGATVIGGKTGYTGDAGDCLVLLCENDSGDQYISIVMGAADKPTLYEDMTALIDQIPSLE